MREKKICEKRSNEDSKNELNFMRASPLMGHDEIALERERGPGSLPRELSF